MYLCIYLLFIDVNSFHEGVVCVLLAVSLSGTLQTFYVSAYIRAIACILTSISMKLNTLLLLNTLFKAFNYDDYKECIAKPTAYFSLGI
jgi:hypothetical protein